MSRKRSTVGAPYLPPWFRCSVCNRDRAGHDAAEAKISPHLRHDWQSVMQQQRALARAKAQTPLLDPND